MKYLFDTHAHLIDRRLAELAEEDLKAVAGALCVYSPDEDINEFTRILLNQKVSASVGIHPHDAARAEKLWPFLLQVLEKDKVVALGETGLDFHYMNSSREAQRKVFRKHLLLSRERSLPVIIHSRDAFDETLQILDEIPPSRAVIHCFSGGSAEMQEYLKRGFYIGIGGIVTFSKADPLKKAVKEAPLEKILLETDCPYLAPVPKRGKTNKPSYLKYIAGEIALLKGKSPEEITWHTYENARVFLNYK